MIPIYLKATSDSPEIILNQHRGKFSLVGRSIPLDAVSFYQPIFDWLLQYKRKPNKESVLHLKLGHLNTVSSKFIIDFCLEFQNLPNSKIIWYYSEEEKEEGFYSHIGEEIALFLDIPLQYK